MLIVSQTKHAGQVAQNSSQNLNREHTWPAAYHWV